jgi:hypothetical protein
MSQNNYKVKTTPKIEFKVVMSEDQGERDEVNKNDKYERSDPHNPRGSDM